MYPNEDAILTDFPMDKNISYGEHIQRLLNFWRSKLVRRTVEYHEAVSRREEKPDDMITVTNARGEASQLSITQIVERRVNPVREARSYVKTLERMLEAANRSGLELEPMWSDEQVLFPAEKVEGELS